MGDRDLSLRVYFDDACPICRGIAAWLRRQPKYVRLDCAPARSAGRGCPLTAAALLQEVTVVASDGAVYRGCNAWLICLWALRDYRAWALRLSRPRWRPLAARLFGVIAWLAARGRRAALVSDGPAG